ncbi:hypothetical protein OIV83_002170 [Microbotryomycetes sp. JL201]|nr:hypothetical protein OIV83_002170 [Microbotryomycetes sp. JL201]
MDKVIMLLVHVIQTVEVRLAQVDLVSLLVNDIPLLLERHIADFDQAVAKSETGVAQNLNLAETFHSMQPHMAIKFLKDEPTGARVPVIDKTYLRTLVEQLLRLLLPPDDYQSDTERLIVREIIVNTILGNVFNRVAQPWFVNGVIIKLLGTGGTTSAYSAEDIAKQPSSALARLTRLFIRLSGAAYLTLQAVIALCDSAVTVASPTTEPTPIVTLDPAITFVLELLPASALLTQIALLGAIPLSLCSSVISATIYRIVGSRIFNVSTVSSVLESATQTLFPEGHAPPKQGDPSAAEQVELERECEMAVAESMPDLLLKVLGLQGPDEDGKLALARHLLRSVSSHPCNIHLVLQLVDLVVARLFPELV